jgi:hypothetical protein
MNEILLCEDPISVWELINTTCDPGADAEVS